MSQSLDYAFYSNNVMNDSQEMSELENSQQSNEFSNLQINAGNMNESYNINNMKESYNTKNDPIKIKRIKNLKIVLWFLIALIIASVIAIVVVALLPGNTAPLVTLSPIPYRP